jgi:hypothetical protein
MCSGIGSDMSAEWSLSKVTEVPLMDGQESQKRVFRATPNGHRLLHYVAPNTYEEPLS